MLNFQLACSFGLCWFKVIFPLKFSVNSTEEGSAIKTGKVQNNFEFRVSENSLN